MMQGALGWGFFLLLLAIGFINIGIVVAWTISSFERRHVQGPLLVLVAISACVLSLAGGWLIFDLYLIVAAGVRIMRSVTRRHSAGNEEPQRNCF